MINKIWVQTSENRIPLKWPALVGVRDVPVFRMNRLNQTEPAVFQFVGSLYFRKIPMSDSLEITTAVVVA